MNKGVLILQQKEDLFAHQDTLARLHENLPLSDKLSFIHQIILQDFPFISRLAIALHDEQTDMLKTYAHSTEGNDSPMVTYEAPLNAAPSLREIIEQRRPRLGIPVVGVIGDEGDVVAGVAQAEPEVFLAGCVLDRRPRRWRRPGCAIRSHRP